MYKAILNYANGKVLKFELSQGAPYETLVDVPSQVDRLFYRNGEFVEGEPQEMTFAQRRIFELRQKEQLKESENSELANLIEQEEQRCIEGYLRHAWEQEAAEKYTYSYSICLIIKDENRYLDEWITYHLGLGFEHIFIYDNLSEVPVEEFLQGKEYMDKITVIRWKGEVYPQREAYAHFIANYEKETQWCLFIDTDEFLHIVKDGVSSIGELLSEYPEVAALFFTWQVYDANGCEQYEDAPVRERFTRKCPNKEWYDGKCIVRPKFIVEQRVHDTVPYQGFAFVDTHHHKKNYQGRNHQRDIAVVDHFYTKSYEEWLAKIERGSSDRDCLKRYKDFFAYNPDLLYLYDESKADEYQKYDYASSEETEAVETNTKSETEEN